MVRSVLVGATALLLACGGQQTATPAPPTDSSTPALVAAEPDHGAHADAKPARGSATDPLVQTLTLPAGDLHVVFVNNLDGEIDPCG